MRVITGSARGRRLKAPPGVQVRPTSAMVKEAVFSAVQFQVEGARVLDLFAGSGQMGIEALSRGARGCVLVDNARDSIAAIRENLAHTGPWEGAQVVQMDALGFLAGYRGEAFDLAFLDPPYGGVALEPVLHRLAERMAAGGVVFCEAQRSAALPRQAGALALAKIYQYGKSQIARYRMPERDEQ